MPSDQCAPDDGVKPVFWALLDERTTRARQACTRPAWTTALAKRSLVAYRFDGNTKLTTATLSPAIERAAFLFSSLGFGVSFFSLDCQRLGSLSQPRIIHSRLPARGNIG